MYIPETYLQLIYILYISNTNKQPILVNRMSILQICVTHYKVIEDLNLLYACSTEETLLKNFQKILNQMVQNVILKYYFLSTKYITMLKYSTTLYCVNHLKRLNIYINKKLNRQYFQVVSQVCHKLQNGHLMLCQPNTPLILESLSTF